MATSTDFHPYLIDRFDKAVCGNTPTLMAPIRGTLKPPDVGGYRYVAASDGLHIEARTGAVEARSAEGKDPASVWRRARWRPAGPWPDTL